MTSWIQRQGDADDADDDVSWLQWFGGEDSDAVLSLSLAHRDILKAIDFFYTFRVVSGRGEHIFFSIAGI